MGGWRLAGWGGGGSTRSSEGEAGHGSGAANGRRDGQHRATRRVSRVIRSEIGLRAAAAAAGKSGRGARAGGGTPGAAGPVACCSDGARPAPGALPLWRGSGHHGALCREARLAAPHACRATGGGEVEGSRALVSERRRRSARRPSRWRPRLPPRPRPNPRCRQAGLHSAPWRRALRARLTEESVGHAVRGVALLRQPRHHQHAAAAFRLLQGAAARAGGRPGSCSVRAGAAPGRQGRRGSQPGAGGLHACRLAQPSPTASSSLLAQPRPPPHAPARGLTACSCMRAPLICRICAMWAPPLPSTAPT